MNSEKLEKRFAELEDGVGVEIRNNQPKYKIGETIFVKELICVADDYPCYHVVPFWISSIRCEMNSSNITYVYGLSTARKVLSDKKYVYSISDAKRWFEEETITNSFLSDKKLTCDDEF